MKITLTDESGDIVTVANLVDAYNGLLSDNAEDFVLKAAIITVLKYFTSETEYASVVTELLGE